MEQQLDFLEKKMLKYYWIAFGALGVLFVSGLLKVLIDAPLMAFGRKSLSYFSTLDIIATLILIPGAYYYYGYQAKLAKADVNPEKKFQLFEMASWIKLGVIVAATLLNCMFYLIAGNFQTILFVIICFIVLLLSKPSKSQYENEFV